MFKDRHNKALKPIIIKLKFDVNSIIVAEHRQIDTVVLIVSAFYNEKRQKYQRILLMTNDAQMQGPAAIGMYKHRWRIEMWFKSVKQQISLGTFQLRKLGSITSHFQLRGLCCLLLNMVRRCGYVHRSL